ncbi:hypothetical protein [Sporomusa acidovorans]|uniref:hypothetical protein n=1 Tax=Sporomusa acidovorans TaxID=112900 RepID=UPI0008872BDC|nr:hypothetical protein [Sporomusa acidovorans]OZC19080.1 hypothetical protein SPACI_31660 [Sporomusa acidovorans DSM 3132]SDD66581.1 hypothetical protein SAMN04488499_100326 [Sporomusa acidovorans]
MKKVKVVLGGIALLLTVSLTAGCGSSQPTSQLAQQAAPQQAASQEHSQGHNQQIHSMPAGDPMPFLADMEKQLADVAAKQKASQTAEAQKVAAQLVQTADKLVPHIMDDGLKNKTRQSAVAIKDAVHAAKVDQAGLDVKIKELQELLLKVKGDLSSHKH